MSRCCSGLLGHALHPVLPDLPLGCWLSASLLDLFGRRGRHRGGAALALALALAGNGLTAASGFLGGYLALERATARPAGA